KLAPIQENDHSERLSDRSSQHWYLINEGKPAKALYFMSEEINSNDKPLSLLRIGGTEVHYYVLCPRKLWWYAHGVEQEHVSGGAGAENVALGSLLHTESYPQKTRKDILIDDLLRLDFTETGVVHEVKKSKGGQRATLFQLLYYLYYLKHEKGIETTGVIDYPALRRQQEVVLTPELEVEVEKIIAGVQAVREQPTPPVVAKPLPICKMCAYQDLCWG
ncbi:MAG: CRISPR-associated protein Cas4, partial [Armatimonadetes bacterium]|nr:CRISPR-associated protein Cas4 [Armatimonadota bacterium]